MGNCKEKPENNEIPGYFLFQERLYKKCYESCETCGESGTINAHNCKACKSDFDFSNNTIPEIDCYKKCKDISKNNDEKISICVIEDGNGNCHPKFPFLINLGISFNDNDKYTNLCVKAFKANENPDCILCQKHELFQYNEHYCQTFCPNPNYYKNYEVRKCEEIKSEGEEDNPNVINCIKK